MILLSGFGWVIVGKPIPNSIRNYHGLRQMPAAQIETILRVQSYILELTHNFSDTQDFIFCGRGINFPNLAL